MVLAEDAAVDRVQETVALAVGGVLQERRREEAVAGRREHDIDGVVHAAGHHRLDAGAVGVRAEDVRGPRDERLAAGECVRLFGERALGPVDFPVGAGVRPVQVVRTPGERRPGEPLDADRLGLRRVELPDARRGADEDVVPDDGDPLRHHQPIDDGRARMEPARLGGREPEQLVRLVLQLLGRRVVRPRRLRNDQVAGLGEGGGDGPLGERRAGGEFDREADRQREGVAVQRHCVPADGCPGLGRYGLDEQPGEERERHGTPGGGEELTAHG